MRKKTWTQCILKSGLSATQAWIETKYAKVGTRLKLKTLDKRVWEVTFAGNVVDSLPEFTFENNI